MGSGLLMVFVQRAALMAVLWWVLAEGRAQSWLIGVPAVAAASVASLALQGVRRWRLRPLAAARILPWFLWRSLVAGVDVALRLMRPRPRIAPGFIELRTRLADPAARVLLADALSLVPGTLSAGLRGNRLQLHVLDRNLPVEREVRATEARIAALFGTPL